MAGEINRKNTVTNPRRDSLLGPGIPHHGSGPGVQLLLFGALRPQDGSFSLAGACTPFLQHPSKPGGASQTPSSFQHHSQPPFSPKPAQEALFRSLGRRRTLRSVRGDGEKEHDVHPQAQTLGVICSGWGSKAPFPFLTAALPHLTPAVHPSMFSHHFIVCQRINKSHPLSPREGCILENC